MFESDEVLEPIREDYKRRQRGKDKTLPVPDGPSAPADLSPQYTLPGVCTAFFLR